MRIKTLTLRIIRQMFRDKRTLALMLIAPLFVMTLIALIFNGKSYHPDIALVDVPVKVKQTFEQTDANVKNVTAAEAEDVLKSEEVDAVFAFKHQKPVLTLEGSDPSANRAVMTAIQQALETQQQAGSLKPDIHYLHGGDDLTSFDNFGPVLLGFFVFFFVFLIAGVSFLRERTTGTLERLLATPLRRWELVGGYLAGFGLFTILQSALIVWYAVYVLDMWMVGSFWYVLVITLLLALTALSLGTLLSAFANNELQMIQFIPLVIVPQVFFSGLFNMETISDWVSWIGPITPLYYGADALREVMLRGGGWADIAADLGVLCVFAVVFIGLNVLALRKYRRL